jgi:hypothetical protein
MSQEEPDMMESELQEMEDTGLGPLNVNKLVVSANHLQKCHLWLISLVGTGIWNQRS